MHPLTQKIALAAMCMTLAACTYEDPKMLMLDRAPRFGRNKLEQSIAKNHVQYIKVGETHRLVFPTDEFFKTNTAQIKRETYPVMNDVTYLLRSYGNRKIHITGYSDDVRTDENSEAYSRHTAQSFLAYFWKHGVDLKRMDAKGLGETDHVATNRDTGGSSHNRRVEVSWDTLG